jgi:hypothetical protein
MIINELSNCCLFMPLSMLVHLCGSDRTTPSGCETDHHTLAAQYAGVKSPQIAITVVLLLFVLFELWSPHTLERPPLELACYFESEDFSFIALCCH